MSWPHTVTIWNRSDDEKYTRAIVEGALWDDSRGVQLRKTVVSSDNGVTVLLPAGIAIRPNDRIIKGVVNTDVTRGSDLDKLGALFVSAVDTFDYGGLPHAEVTCK